MTRTNFRICLRFYLARVPFVPFEIELVSGRRFRIGHPQAIELKEELVAYRTPAGGYRVFECEAIVRFLDIEESITGGS
jgi:hypothetical protein